MTRVNVDDRLFDADGVPLPYFDAPDGSKHQRIPPRTRPHTDLGEIADGGSAECGLSNDSTGKLVATTGFSVAAAGTITINPNSADIAAIPAGMSATATFYVDRANAAAAVNFGAGWGVITWSLLNPTDGSTAQNPPPLVVQGGEVRVSITVTDGDTTRGSWS